MEAALRLEMRPSVSPALLAFTEMLALPAADLENLIAAEVTQNPALERADVPACPWCGSGNHPHRCPAGPVPQADAGPGTGRTTSDWAGADWAAPSSGAEELLAEVRLGATAAEAALAAYVIGSLDERGFLPGGPEQVAADLGIPLAVVCSVLGVLRQAGPPAIAACDVRESLLLQLDAQASAGPARDLARAIADRHLDHLARGRTDTIAAALGCSPPEVAAAVACIRRHCAPFPAPGLRAPLPGSGVPAVPDVVVTLTERRGAAPRVEVLRPARLALRVSPGYERLAAGATGQESGQQAAELVRRAGWLISRLEERHRTMRQVVEHAADRQRAFVARGPRFLRPLAQADVARGLGIHESTVSRAVAGKYMMLPARGVVPVQDFFRASLAPQDALRRLVAGETRPLTDTELADALRAQGFRVARRTVAKYRQALGIAAAPLRGPALATAK